MDVRPHPVRLPRERATDRSFAWNLKCRVAISAPKNLTLIITTSSCVADAATQNVVGTREASFEDGFTLRSRLRSHESRCAPSNCATQRADDRWYWEQGDRRWRPSRKGA